MKREREEEFTIERQRKGREKREMCACGCVCERERERREGEREGGNWKNMTNALKKPIISHMHRAIIKGAQSDVCPHSKQW